MVPLDHICCHRTSCVAISCPPRTTCVVVSGPPTFSSGTSCATLQMISVNVSVIHNNAQEFYRANTLRAASCCSSVACAVTIFTCILCYIARVQLIGVANKMRCLRRSWAYSKHNIIASFSTNLLCLGVAVIPRSGGFLGFSC